MQEQQIAGRIEPGGRSTSADAAASTTPAAPIDPARIVKMLITTLPAAQYRPGSSTMWSRKSQASTGSRVDPIGSAGSLLLPPHDWPVRGPFFSRRRVIASIGRNFCAVACHSRRRWIASALSPDRNRRHARCRALVARMSHLDQKRHPRGNGRRSDGGSCSPGLSARFRALTKTP